MPEVNTKYNRVSKLQLDLSNNYNLYGSNYILTCDPSDNFIDNNQYKVYLNSRASYYIHPFSQVSNCQNIFDSSNSLFNIKIPARVPIDNSSSIFKNYIQKQIQNVVGVKSSLYTNNLASLYVNEISGTLYKPWNNASDRLVQHGLGRNKGLDIKYNSYDRYLARKKSQYFRTENNSSDPPKYGNKTFKLGIVTSNSCTKNC
tara:strand:- start:5037 stop:5642 length:606 start_codon:yes stop_codon:yes gene_type:complete